MTALQAFEQAQETGQIAISKNTAKAFAALMRLEEVFYDDMMAAITENYAPQSYDEMVEPYVDIFSELSNKLQEGIMKYCIFSNGLSDIQFTGI